MGDYYGSLWWPLSSSNSVFTDHCHQGPGHSNHTYCGKHCRDQAQAAASSWATFAPPDPTLTRLCNVCNIRPRYNDGVMLHLYCGRTCSKRLVRPRPSLAVSHAQHSLANLALDTVLYVRFLLFVALCGLPSCAQPVWINPVDGVPSAFCSIAHRDQATMGNGFHQASLRGTVSIAAQAVPVTPANCCITCRKRAVNRSGLFCSQTCADPAQAQAPGIVEVPEGHDRFESVSDQFNATWQEATKPTIRHVYKVMVPLDSIGSLRNLSRKYSSPQKLRPTTRLRKPIACSLGEPGQTTLCSITTCGVCGIIRMSFDMKKAGARDYGFYGTGIYTSSTSSCSNSYITNTAQSTLRAMFLNKVVIGRTYYAARQPAGTTAPPSGYDSIMGGGPRGTHNNECVVFHKDAIRPSWLIIYGG